MNKYIAEFIGTFFLVLTIGCTGIGAGTGVIPPLAIGAALMVMVFAGGHISGAHYNPAVTLGVLIRGRLKPADAVPYMIAQVIAAAVAAIVVTAVLRAGADGHSHCAKARARASRRVPLHLCARLRGPERRDRGRDFRQFLLRPGHRHDGHDGRVCRRRHLRRGVQSRGRGRHFCHRHFELEQLWIYLLADFAAGVLAALVFNAINPPAQVDRSRPRSRLTRLPSPNES